MQPGEERPETLVAVLGARVVDGVSAEARQMEQQLVQLFEENEDARTEAREIRPVGLVDVDAAVGGVMLAVETNRLEHAWSVRVVAELVAHESLLGRGVGWSTAMPQNRVRVSLFEKRAMIDRFFPDLHRLHGNPNLFLLECGVRSERTEVRKEVGD